MAQSSYSLKVGESKFIKLPSPSAGVIQNAGWGCNHANVIIDEESTAGAIIHIDHYYEDIATIEVWYNYMWYDNNGYPHVNDSIAYFQISCIAQYATLSDSSLVLEEGESYQLDVSMSGYGGFSPTWRSGNSGIASVDRDGLVHAYSAGTTTIYCDPIIGPEETCSVRVTAASSGGDSGSSDDDDYNYPDNDDDYWQDDDNQNNSYINNARGRILGLIESSKQYLN